MAGRRRPGGRLHSGVNVMCLISGFVPREIISALVNPSKSPSQAELWLQALSAPAGRGRSQAEPPSELMKVDSCLGGGGTCPGPRRVKRGLDQSQLVSSAWNQRADASTSGHTR